MYKMGLRVHVSSHKTNCDLLRNMYVRTYMYIHVVQIGRCTIEYVYPRDKVKACRYVCVIVQYYPRVIEAYVIVIPR